MKLPISARVRHHCLSVALDTGQEWEVEIHYAAGDWLVHRAIGNLYTAKPTYIVSHAHTGRFVTPPMTMNEACSVARRLDAAVPVFVAVEDAPWDLIRAALGGRPPPLRAKRAGRAA